jgi:hypothetical protein
MLLRWTANVDLKERTRSCILMVILKSSDFFHKLDGNMAYKMMKLYSSASKAIHSPGMYRGYVPLQNIQAFYDAFDIKEGDKMYVQPADHCDYLVT